MVRGGVGMREAGERARGMVERGEVAFCVGARVQEMRELAERLAVESAVGDGRGGWGVEWCVRAVEVGGGEEGARRWLEKEGVRVGER